MTDVLSLLRRELDSVDYAIRIQTYRLEELTKRRDELKRRIAEMETKGDGFSF